MLSFENTSNITDQSLNILINDTSTFIPVNVSQAEKTTWGSMPSLRMG